MITHHFSYLTNVIDDKHYEIKITHHCEDKDCSTADICYHLSKEEIKDILEEGDKGTAYINKMIFDLDEKITQHIHEMHDLICIKNSMIKI